MELTAPTAITNAPTTQMPRVTDTLWGYVIHEDVDRFEHGKLSVAALRFAGLILVLSAYGQWALPASLYGGDAVLAKSAVSLLLGLLGVLIYGMASRPVRIDVQVDLTRRELRLSEAADRGPARLRAVVPMAQVASAFVARTKNGSARPQLFLEMRDRADVVHVATGDEADLLILHRRLSHDLRPIEERIDRRLALAVPFRSRRSDGEAPHQTVQQ